MQRNNQTSEGLSRRLFLGRAVATTAAAFTIVPARVLGGSGKKAPSDTLNIACVGIGGMGQNNVKACLDAGENIVALCDVDDKFAEKVYKEYPEAKKYRDFRVMLEKQKDIDAVIVATPDHTHTIIAITAMKMGKHVYVQKPLTRTIWEARKLTEAARQYKVATQMGNQGHSDDGVRKITEWIAAGVIGEVREVHCKTNRPIWPQGLDRPEEKVPVPKTLDWNLFLGPAPYRPYNPIYHPFNWRAWWDFGTGVMGDMGCHILDPVYTALKLKYPETIEASSTPVNEETAPLASIVRYLFPAREGMPPVQVTWWDGGLLPPRPDELEPDEIWEDVLFIGTKGKIICTANGRNPRLLPTKLMQDFVPPKETIPRIQGSHEEDWIRACKGGQPACSHFDHAGPLTEVVLAGNLAVRYGGKKLEWDGDKMQVTNFPEAKQYVLPMMRAGFTI